jgi:hypothetical protein
MSVLSGAEKVAEPLVLLPRNKQLCHKNVIVYT